MSALALTGGAKPPPAFPLLKADRQCANGDSFSQTDPFRTSVVGVRLLLITYPKRPEGRPVSKGGAEIVVAHSMMPDAGARSPSARTR
jgi:hypothetical protein